MAERRVVLLGIDSVSLDWLETFVRRGVMPHVSRLIEAGTLSPMLSFYPVDTGTNWASIATGASPMVHGCNMQMHLPGEALDRRVRSFPAGYLRAEPIWLTAQRAGKTAVVFDYPHSYPFQNAERLLHVGEDGRPDNAIRALQEVRAYVAGPRWQTGGARGPHVLEVRLAPANSGEDGWRNVPASPAAGPPYLAAELPVLPGEQSRYREVASLWALVWPGAEGYDRVSVHAHRDPARPLATVRLGERSPWVYHRFDTDQGTVEAAFLAKLLRLAGDASDFQLYLTEIYPTGDFAHPPGLGADLLRAAGPFLAQPSRQQVVLGGASDIATYFEEQVACGAWYERAMRHVLGSREWDVCALKWHSLDWTNHLFAYATEPRHPLYDPAREPEAWRYWDQLFAQADGIVGAAWEAAGPDVVLALTSDHGSDAVPPGSGGYDDLNALLEREAWLVRDGNRFDWARSRAFASGYYVWLNVKGRDPSGVVEPGAAYLHERERLIELLLAARRQRTGAPLLRTAWPIEEALPLGIGGDRTGDIFVQPWHSEAEADEAYRVARDKAGEGRFGTWDWPTVNSGSHHPHTFVVLAGRGIRTGYRRSRAAMLSAIAPTLCHAAGLPVPAQSDGPVLWDVLA